MFAKPILVCVVGATAIGKTACAIEIAKAFSTEIISADSRQFYKEMSIGTAVPSKEELDSVPHHFIHNKSIFEPYSVGDFEKEAIVLLNQLFKKHRIVVMVGGSGLYVDAVVNGLDHFPEIPTEIRLQLNKIYEEKGIAPLLKELQKVDSSYFQTVDRANHHRIIRALEIYRGTGKPYSSFLKNTSIQRNFDTQYIGLTADREIIYSRINKRIDQMIIDGLEEEAKVLYPHRDINALQTVGYRELFSFFDNEISRDAAIEEIKKNTRRFAKRQGTWSRKNRSIHWFSYPFDHSEVVSYVKNKSVL